VDQPAATISALGTLFAAIGAFITAAGAFWLSYRNSRRAEKARIKAAAAVQAAKDEAAAAALKAAIAAELAADAKKAIVKVGDDLFLVGKAIDGRLSELLELTRVSAIAEGRLQVEAEQKASADEGAP
jgi:hypothetical protein